MESKLVAQRRTKFGTSENRRLRAQGLIPGNVYGHRQDNVALLFSAKEVTAFVNTTHRVVEIELDGKSETTILRETQWNAFHTELQHVDFLRVDRNERVKVDVEVLLKGAAAGAMKGGVLDQPLHSLHVDCLAVKIPDGIFVKVNNLEIGQAIHVKDLELPEGVTVLNNADAIVVRVVQPIIVEAPVAVEGTGPAEPEVIKKERKTAEEGAEEAAKPAAKK